MHQADRRLRGPQSLPHGGHCPLEPGTRQDFINNAPDDAGADATNGCTTLFIYYLHHQLDFSINQIVAAAGVTLAAVYRNLTNNSDDPFPHFKQLLDSRFPLQTASDVPGPNFDDPGPIMAQGQGVHIRRPLRGLNNG
jgi:hypothetical protein